MDAPPERAPVIGAADIPSVDRLLNRPALASLIATHGRTQVTSTLRSHLEELRGAALAGELQASALADTAIAGAVEDRLTHAARPRLRAVFNLSGTVLHTNLGRAPLSEAATEAVVRAAGAPVNLEYDLASGRRGDRDALVEETLCELCGAEAATVVNNNAAAVLLLLSALASRREVVISRGELIEIGGSFRMPDIMRQAGAKLVEVGTTNRTHSSDYAEALGPRTALLMKVHTSNYAITGFASSVPVAELAPLARAHAIPLAVDLGSGALVDLTCWGLPAEPTVRDAVAAGADVVAFSADKLLGGPQAGLLVGRADLIRRLKKHPLKRALRVGKLTIAALEATLALYRAPEFLAERLATLRLLARSPVELQAQAERLQPLVQRALGATFVVSHAPMHGQIGSGALPSAELASYGLVVRPAARRRGGLDRLDAALRALPRPVIGRIAEQALWLDLRCLEESDERAFAEQWSAIEP